MRRRMDVILTVLIEGSRNCLILMGLTVVLYEYPASCSAPGGGCRYSSSSTKYSIN